MCASCSMYECPTHLDHPHVVAQGFSVCLDLAMSYICTPRMLVLAIGLVLIFILALAFTPHSHAPLFVYYSVAIWVSISIPVF